MTALLRGSVKRAVQPSGLGNLSGWLDRLLLVVPGPLLEGERVYLRPPRLSDWREWAALRRESRAFLKPWEPTWPADALSRRAFRRRLRFYYSDARAGRSCSFFIFARDGDRLAGGITLSNIRRGVTQSCSTGYWIGQPLAGRGYMGDAMRTLLPWVFRDLGLHRLEAACLPSNLPSCRLLRSCGFSEEGYASRYLRIDGAWRDHLLFALVKDDVYPAAAASGGRDQIKRDPLPWTTGSDQYRDG